MDRGEIPAVPAPGFTWKTADMDKLNRYIYETHCQQSLDEVLSYYHTTFERFMACVEAVPEEMMFTSGGFNFIGKGTPAQWFMQYVWHDGWGISNITKFRKARSAKD